MIVGHVSIGLPRDIIYSFHMPLFIIISGMFYKERNYDENIKNIFFKLILPYVICTLVVGILQCNNIQLLGDCIKNWIKQIAFSYGVWGKIQYSEYIPPLNVLWFFPLLAGIRLIFNSIKKISKDDHIKLLFLIALVSYAGYILGIKLYWLPFSLDVSMFCISFYYIGYILKTTNMLEKILSDKRILIMILLIWIIGIKFNSVDIAGRVYPNGAFSILSSVCGTIMIFKISQIIEKYLKHLGNILEWYGRNSMLILLFHYADVKLTNYSKVCALENKKLALFLILVIKISIATTGTLIINGIKKAFYYIKNRINFKPRQSIT